MRLHNNITFSDTFYFEVFCDMKMDTVRYSRTSLEVFTEQCNIISEQTCIFTSTALRTSTSSSTTLH